jgi:hypothetical protein
MLLAQAAVPKSTVVLLVRLNLWHDQGDHYLLHDWHEYIRSKEEVLAEREAARLRKAKSRRESHRDVQRESRRESQGESQDSRPDPSRISVKPPTGYLRGAALTGTAGDVLKLILDAERKKSGPVRNPSAWEATVTDRLLSEHGERIQQCVEDFPTAPADVIAGHVLGQTNNLRYYPRRESA